MSACLCHVYARKKTVIMSECVTGEEEVDVGEGRKGEERKHGKGRERERRMMFKCNRIRKFV